MIARVGNFSVEFVGTLHFEMESYKNIRHCAIRLGHIQGNISPLKSHHHPREKKKEIRDLFYNTENLLCAPQSWQGSSKLLAFATRFSTAFTNVTSVDND